MKRVFAILAILLIAGCTIPEEDAAVVEMNANTFVVEIADTPAEQTQGLMFRESMPKNRGMLFIFPDEQPREFWMKNTLIPLDIIYLDKNWRVVSIQQNATPCVADTCPTYPSKKAAQYVLEINAGESKARGFRLGMMARTSMNSE